VSMELLSNGDPDDANDQSAQAESRVRSQSAVPGIREYADAIDVYSKLNSSHSLYPGAHYENLAAYLHQPFEARAPTLNTERIGEADEANYRFVTLHDLNPATGAATRAKHIDSITEFQSEVGILNRTSTHGHLLFIRGHPSPEWLLAIGSSYQLDPEFFRRHLDFRLGRQEFFSSPSLPSTSTAMIRLRTTTIGGLQQVSARDDGQSRLEILQAESARSMDEYRKRLRSLSDPSLGDSIIRDCSVHDLQHFSVEQDVSVNICKTENSWAGIVWLDNGKDLSKGLASWALSPLQTPSWKTINYLPVVQFRPSVALKPRSHLLAPRNANERAQIQIHQSASLLHLAYGRQLDNQVAGSDALYALHEIFRFSSFSEVQFLNMLESKLKKELDQSVLVRQKNSTLSNLLYNQQVLDRHTQRLRENIASINVQSRISWPGAALEDNKRAIADCAANSLLQDYEHLLSRCQTLSEYCNRGMQIVMNNAMIKESQEAMSQAERFGKLTRLAFIFVPLSFTTSFFGMNFTQLGNGDLNIWIWFVTSAPVFGLSMLMMKYDIFGLLQNKDPAN